MNKVLIVCLFLASSLAANSQITKVIKELNPNIDDKVAKEYAIIIDKYSKEFGVDWKIVCAIFRQESNFKVDAVNYKSRDFGIGQINYRNIVVKKLDIGGLLTNADYAIKQTFIMLKDLKKGYAKRDGKRWYTRYHSFDVDNRKIYNETLSSWFKKIEDVINGRSKQETADRSEPKSDQRTTRAPLS